MLVFVFLFISILSYNAAILDGMFLWYGVWGFGLSAEFVNYAQLLDLMLFSNFFQLEKGESFFSFARDMTIRSTKAMVQPTSIPEDLGPWKSKLLWASRVLPMPLVGLFIIGTVCDVGSSASEYPELEALSRLDFGAAMKVFLAKRLTSE